MPEAAASMCMIFQYVPAFVCVCVCVCVQCFWQSDLRFGSLEHIILWLQLWLAKWCKNLALHHLCNVVHIIPKTSEVFVRCHHFLVKAGKRTAVFLKIFFFKMLWNNSFTITLSHRAVGDTCPQKNAVTLVHYLRYLTLTCLSIQKDLMMSRVKWSWAKHCCMYIDP